MDTTFVIDASLCEDLRDWNRLLKFVQTLVRFYDVSPAVGRVALVPFSTKATVVLKFNTLTGELLNGDEVNRRVSLLQCQGGSRRIDKALDLTCKEVVTAEAGARGVSKVMSCMVFLVLFCLLSPFVSIFCCYCCCCCCYLSCCWS